MTFPVGICAAPGTDPPPECQAAAGVAKRQQCARDRLGPAYAITPDQSERELNRVMVLWRFSLGFSLSFWLRFSSLSFGSLI